MKSCVPLRSAVYARVWFAAVALMPVCLMADPTGDAKADPPANDPTVAGITRQNRPGAGLPMSFEANQGQFADDIKFRSRGAGYSVVLRPTEAVLLLEDKRAQKRGEILKQRRAPSKRGGHPEPLVQSSVSAVVHLSMVGANTDAEAAGESKLPGVANYFLGNDPALWRTAVPLFEKVRYSRVYPGIDLVYYGNQRQLEYDFVVGAGANPDDIRIRLDGVDGLSVDAGGDLIAQIGTRFVRWQIPRAYQVEGRSERPVAAEFVVDSADQVSFHVGHYDPARPLIIDPLLVYSSYLGGGNADSAAALAVDGAGNTYLAGRTASANFPVFKAYGSNLFGQQAVFVTKLNSDATALVFSTYIGGNSNAWANAIAVDTSNNIYVAGYSESNYPLKNAAHSYSDFGDAVLTKLGPFGTNLLYSTYFGGANYEEAFGVAVDNSGNAFLMGQTYSGFNGAGGFPTVPNNNPFTSSGGYGEVFVTKINTAASGSASVTWAGYFGGDLDEAGYAIALDSGGNVYVTGTMLCQSIPGEPCPGESGGSGAGFPIRNAFQSSFGGGYADAFLVKINSSVPSVVFSTYLGGSDDDSAYGVAVDSSNNVYVTGETYSADFPIINSVQPAIDGFNTVAFVSKFDSSGANLLYSTFYGGSRDTGGRSIALDRFRNAYIVGYTFSADLPVTPGAPQTNRGGTTLNRDLFVAKFNPSVPGPSSLVFASYFGGSDDEAINAGYQLSYNPAIGLAVDNNLNLYIASDTLSTNLPTTNGFQTTFAGEVDAFAAKIASPPDISVAVVASPNVVIVGSNLVYTIYANNNGLTTFSNVTVTDLLPSSLTYLSGANTFPGGTISNFSGTITCTFNNLTNGAAGIATFTVATAQPGTATNTATISATPSDVNTNNNSSRAVTIIRGLADVGLSMTDAPDPIVSTSNLFYTITVTNRGPWPATADPGTTTKAIVIRSPIPVGANYVAASGGFAVPLFDGTAVNWFLGGLSNGGSATLSLTLRPVQGAGLLTTTASVSGYYELDLVASNNAATTTTTVIGLADLSIQISEAPDPVFASSNLTYTIIVTNPGPTSANSVQVVDALPAGFTFVSATAPGGSTQFQGVVTCYLGSMSTGAVATATIQVRPPLDGLVTNSATVSSAAVDPFPTNNSASVVTTVSPLANLVIGKTVSPTTVVVTSNLVYTISVTNFGPTSASGVVVTDPLPVNMVFVSAQSDQGTCTQDGGIVTCNLGTMTNNGKATITIKAAPLIEGPLSNMASVAAATTDPVADNNSPAAVVSVTNHPAGPILRIAGIGTNVRLYWTTNSAGYSLQSNPGLSSSNLWQSVTNTPRVVGTQYYVTNSIGSSPKYYRLVKLPPATPEGPLLRIAISGTNVLLCWTTNSIGYLLQSNPDLSSSNLWQSVTDTPRVVGTDYYVTNSIGPSPKYYRLFKPPPPPTLAATISGTNVAVSWPTNYAGFLVQKNNSLIQSNTWTTLSNLTTIQAGRFIYFEPATNPATFYRLVRFQ